MKIKLTSSIDADIAERIKIQAILEKSNVSKIIERLLTQYLDGLKK